MKNFAITGVAGYIANRHLRAIKDTGNRLVAAVDPSDSVGILDSYFPDVSFFTEIERFDRHLEKLKRNGETERVHYLSICSPNHLHDAHIRLALRIGAHAICEKPLVLKPWNLDALQRLEEETQCRVYTILQLRLHPVLIELKQKLDFKPQKKYNVDLTYITSRGKWYDYSWKGDQEKSGGIGTNIGIHFFDMLVWLFGKVIVSQVHLRENRRMSGFIELEKANVRWFLSIDRNDLPKTITEAGKPTYRSIQLDGQEIQFSEGFTELHTKSYEKILNSEGFGIDDARAAVSLAHLIRDAHVVNSDSLHPFLTTHLENKLSPK